MTNLQRLIAELTEPSRKVVIKSFDGKTVSVASRKCPYCQVGFPHTQNHCIPASIATDEVN